MKNILIVIDMQNGFARTEQMVKLSERIKVLLKRDLFDSVIATRFLNNDKSMFEKMFGWYRLKAEDERQIISGIEEYVDCYVDKYIYNCVTPSFIQRLCQLNDGEYPKKVFIIGADTDCCVLTIATALFENNIRPIVLTKYVDSNGGSESHKAGLLVLKRLIGKNQLVDVDPASREDLDII